MHKIMHNECEGLNTFYLRHFKQLDVIFSPMLLKVHSGRFDRILGVEPPLFCNTSPSVMNSPLCEGYIVCFGLIENFLPELSMFIQFH